ncbi:amidophosphoribosyltransferase [Candidatus Microgenomates bacterium]|nr:MAG: amidophosphoribosyltransferase [Candidatus Microgenomates bacterium]
MEKNQIHDKCAVFGIYDPELDVARITYYALYGLQHRGQESSGIAVSNGKRFKIRRRMGLVRDVFKKEKDITRLGRGMIAVGHNRYSTTGSSHVINAQPFIIEKDQRQIAIAHNGNIINTRELKAKVKEIKLHSTTDTEIIGALLLESKETTWEKRFDEVLPQVQGAYSFVISTRDLLFGIRDPYGIRPLALGKLNDGWVLSSEDCIFPGIGATFVREIEPGEAVIIDKDGPKSFYRQEIKKRAFCIFEYVYFARPDSTFYGHSVGKVREKSGEILAEESPVDADMVMSVPDSGTTAAIAFAKKSNIPLGEGVIKNRYIGRTFIQPDQRLRELGIKLKFGPMRVNLEGKRVIVVDDSIVRGTTMRDFISLLKSYGAKEVHIRIACPPITDPCFYGVDMPTKEELISNQFEKSKNNVDVNKIKNFLGADSLAYLSLNGLLRAAGTNIKEGFKLDDVPYCLACLTGNYKIKVAEKVSKLQFENSTDLQTKKIAVLVSNKGTGTNLQAIIDGIENGKIKAKIAVVISDKDDAYGLMRARKYNIPTQICPNKENLLSILQKYKVDFVALAGWKQIITDNVIKTFNNRILNTHPGLVPDEMNGVVLNPDGTKALWNKGKFTNKAMQSFLENKATFAGCSNHFLTNEFDFGPVLGRCFEKIKPKDTVDSLYSRLKVKENKLYVESLAKVCK